MSASPRPPGAVLFDLDGTLLDTAPDLGRALNRVLARHGRPPLPPAAIRPHVSHGARALVALGFGLAPGDPEYEDRRQDLLAEYQAHLARETRLFPGMEAVLRHCRERRIPWGVVTNKPGWLTDPLLAALDLDRRAAFVVSGDTTPTPKPHPAPLLHACAAVDADPGACLYVGDAARDVTAARAAGMAVVVALFGYIPPEEEPLGWGADGYLEAPEDLLPWL